MYSLQNLGVLQHPLNPLSYPPDPSYVLMAFRKVLVNVRGQDWIQSMPRSELIMMEVHGYSYLSKSPIMFPSTTSSTTNSDLHNGVCVPVRIHVWLYSCPCV